MSENYDPARAPHLAKWAERQRLGLFSMKCPGCGRTKCFKPYLTPDGQVIDEKVGRCDHESSCGYHVTPSEWKKNGGTIPEWDEEKAKEWQRKNPTERIELPFSLVTARNDARNNVLLRYLFTVFPKDALIAAATRLFIGTTQPKGDTIFWLIDDRGKVRSGKVMRYKEDGHRWKDEDGKGRMNWIHSMLWKHNGYALCDPDRYQFEGCLFGLHQIGIPKYEGREVHIVESEKTALVGTTVFPQFLWMATGGLANLNVMRLKPVMDQGRTIQLHPDKDGAQKWATQLNTIQESCGYEHIYISPVMEDYWTEADGSHADLCDVLIRLALEQKTVPAETVLARMKTGNPALQTLIDTFNLKLITDNG